MAEQTYQDYRLARLAAQNGPVEPEPVVVETSEAEVQDSPPVSTEVVEDTLDEDLEADDTPEEPDPQQRDRRRNRTENRFKRLNDRNRRLENENAELRGRVQAIEAMLNADREPAAPATPTPDPARPVREQFADDDAYLEALTDYKVEQAFEADRTRRAETERTTAQTEADRIMTERETAARAVYDDFDEAIRGATIDLDPRVPELIGTYMYEEAEGFHVAYHYATHLDELAALDRMTPFQRQRAVEAVFRRYAQAAPAETSAAPPETPPTPPAPSPPAPISPLRDTGQTTELPPADQMTYQQYRQQRLAGRL